MTRDEEVRLSERVLAGDPEAREEMIVANRRLVAKVAKCYKATGVPILDLIQEGTLGLIRAVEGYQASVGKFSTYAVYWIKLSIIRSLSDAHHIRVPSRIALARLRLKRGGDAGSLGGRDRANIEHANRVLDNPPESPGSYEFADHRGHPGLDPDDAMDLDAVMGHWERLDDLERLVLSVRYGLNGYPAMTCEGASRVVVLERDGREKRYTKQGIHQIEKRAVAKLRKGPRPG